LDGAICNACSYSRPSDTQACNHIGDGVCDRSCEGFYNESVCSVQAGDRITLKSGGEFVHKNGNRVITADDGTSKISIYVESISSGSYALRYWNESIQDYLYHEGNKMWIGTRPVKFSGYFMNAPLYKGSDTCITFNWGGSGIYVDPDISGRNKQIGENSKSCTNFTVCDEFGSCSF